MPFAVGVPEAPPPEAAAARVRLRDLDPHLHCSVIGTCLTTGELRKLMGRYVETEGASDLEVHHEAVRRACQEGEVSRALHKALAQRHDGAVRRFARAADAAALLALWEQALHDGDVPGAYWAVLTHKQVTPELRQRVFGDVHMLSHLVGASNRADLQRLIALERDNEALHQRLERQQAALDEALRERDAARAAEAAKAAECLRVAAAAREGEVRPPAHDALAAAVALQTERRERAESERATALAEADRLARELDHARAHAAALVHELAAAEAALRDAVSTNDDDGGALAAALRGRRLLYVGGRPSSGPAIRDLVLSHGGEFQRHDGGLEDRKGQLAAALAWADLVVFPVDCIDHDSALALKRACQRDGKAFTPLRSASITSFAAGVADAFGAGAPQAPGAAPPCCAKHR